MWWEQALLQQALLQQALLQQALLQQACALSHSLLYPDQIEAQMLTSHNTMLKTQQHNQA